MCMLRRVSSGAQIKIAGNEGDNQDRLVTITGTPEAVGMAQYLINSRLVFLQRAIQGRVSHVIIGQGNRINVL